MHFRDRERPTCEVRRAVGHPPRASRSAGDDRRATSARLHPARLHDSRYQRVSISACAATSTTIVIRIGSYACILHVQSRTGNRRLAVVDTRRCRQVPRLEAGRRRRRSKNQGEILKFGGIVLAKIGVARTLNGEACLWALLVCAAAGRPHAHGRFGAPLANSKFEASRNPHSVSMSTTAAREVQDTIIWKVER